MALWLVVSCHMSRFGAKQGARRALVDQSLAVEGLDLCAGNTTNLLSSSRQIGKVGEWASALTNHTIGFDELTASTVSSALRQNAVDGEKLDTLSVSSFFAMGITPNKRHARFILSRWQLYSHSSAPDTEFVRSNQCWCRPGYVRIAEDEHGKKICVGHEDYRSLKHQVEEAEKLFDLCSLGPCENEFEKFTATHFPLPQNFPLQQRLCNAQIPRVQGFYHVTALGERWWAVVSDQMRSLRDSGLLQYGTLRLGVNAVQADADQIRGLVAKTENATVAYVNINRSSWYDRMEGPTLRLMRDYCRNPQNEDHLVYYIHSKGVSKQDKGSWAASLFWRKYMEHWVVERPEFCIASLSADESKPPFTCGVDYSLHHYSGNFWWATCTYISELTPPCDEYNIDGKMQSAYTCGEEWLGKDIDAAHAKAMWHDKRSLYQEPIFRTTYGIPVVQQRADNSPSKSQTKAKCTERLLLQGHIVK